MWGGIVVTEGIAYSYVFENFTLYGILVIIFLTMSSYFSTRIIYESYLLDRTIHIKIINTKREKSINNKLLLSTLPSSVIERLKENATSVHDYVASGTCCFLSLDNFTNVLAHDGAVAIRVLGEIFDDFDQCVDLHGCQKIKSVGSTYLAICNTSLQQEHCERVAMFTLTAMEIAYEVIGRYQRDMNLEPSLRRSIGELGLKVGIHTGNFMAGVLGSKKYLYDVFGDCINIASRMCSTSEKRKIQLCSETKDILNKSFLFERRGWIDVKGKGKLETYYLQFPVSRTLSFRSGGSISADDIEDIREESWLRI
jgi:adenylate cyclase